MTVSFYPSKLAGMGWRDWVQVRGACWMWTGCQIGSGHGSYGGTTAHRAIYRELRGDPTGRLVNSCGSKLCVNPDHWEVLTEEDRFWSKVNKTRKCWLWVGAHDSRGRESYGFFVDSEGRQVLAHRKSWELANGYVPDGRLVLHSCDTPRCVRPDHLFLGDQAVNKADSISKGRHAHAETHGASKLSWEDVHSIRNRYSSGETQADIATDHGISQRAISSIVNGKTWKEA